LTTTKRALRRGGFALFVTGLAALAAAIPAAAQTVEYESKIRLKNAAPAFHGKVKSDSSMCVSNRKVRLFKAKRGEDDKLLGKTRTDAEGRWEILKTPKSGVYYAKVNQLVVEGSYSCLPDKSKKVVID
jgi:hypothetical protein